MMVTLMVTNGDSPSKTFWRITAVHLQMERERGSVVAAMLQLLQTHELSPWGPTAELQTHMSSVNSTQHMSSVHTGKHNPLLQNVDSQLLSPSMHTGLCPPHMLQYILHALYTEYELHCRCSVDCNDLRCSQDTASFQAKSYVTAKSCIM